MNDRHDKTATPAALDAVPFPVAYPLHFARSAALSTTERRNNAIFACYQAVRLTALLLLADYVNPDEPETDETLTSHIRALVNPHWQDWAHLADAMAGFWAAPARRERALFPDLADAWGLVSRRRREPAPPRDPALDAMAASFPGLGGTPAARSANEAVWALRNSIAHRFGAATPDDAAANADELDRLLPLTEAIVQRLFGAGHFTLLRAVRTPGALHVIRLDGPHPDLRFIPVLPNPAWLPDFAPTDVVAVAGNRSIPVYPMFVPTHDDGARPLFASMTRRR